MEVSCQDVYTALLQAHVVIWVLYGLYAFFQAGFLVHYVGDTHGNGVLFWLAAIFAPAATAIFIIYLGVSMIKMIINVKPRRE